MLQIIACKRSIIGDTALRLDYWIDAEPELWMSREAQHDLAIAVQEIGEAVEALPAARQIA